jgi:YVTN family beta-propeller protein
VRYVDTVGSPHDILFAPDGRLWVTDWNGALHMLEGRRGKLVRSVPLGEEAHHLDFTPDGRFCWITDHGAGAIFVLRVKTARVVERIAFPGEPHHVTVLPGGRRVVVADHANGRLIVYDAETREQVRAIPVGSQPHGVWAVGSQRRPSLTPRVVGGDGLDTPIRGDRWSGAHLPSPRLLAPAGPDHEPRRSAAAIGAIGHDERPPWRGVPGPGKAHDPTARTHGCLLRRPTSSHA